MVIDVDVVVIVHVVIVGEISPKSIESKFLLTDQSYPIQSNQNTCTHTHRITSHHVKPIEPDWAKSNCPIRRWHRCHHYNCNSYALDQIRFVTQYPRVCYLAPSCKLALIEMSTQQTHKHMYMAATNNNGRYQRQHASWPLFALMLAPLTLPCPVQLGLRASLVAHGIRAWRAGSGT